MYKKFFTLHSFILSFFHSFFALLIVGCSGPYVPENAQRINAKPAIYPDYTDVTLPANLCAPNFMVKAIAESSEVKMPSFFGYMIWSLCFLVPVFILDTLIWFW